MVGEAYSVWQDPRQVSGESLINCQQPLGLNRLHKAIQSALILITRLVVHPAHDGIGRVHHTADHEPAGRGRGQVQSHAVSHPQMLLQPPLGKEVRGQLHARPEARSDHRRPRTPIPPLHPLGRINPPEPVYGALVFVLRAYGQERGVTLQSRLDEEERGADGGAQDARRRAGEDIDGEVLLGGVVVEEGCYGGADGLVEAQAAPVEHDLVAVRGA